MNILFYIFFQVLHSVDIIIISSCVCGNIYYIIRIIRSIWFVSRARTSTCAYAVKNNKMIYVDVLCALLIYAVVWTCRVDIRDCVSGGDVASWTFAKFMTRTWYKCKQFGAHHLIYASTFMKNEQVEADGNSSAIFHIQSRYNYILHTITPTKPEIFHSNLANKNGRKTLRNVQLIRFFFLYSRDTAGTRF